MISGGGPAYPRHELPQRIEQANRHPEVIAPPGPDCNQPEISTSWIVKSAALDGKGNFVRRQTGASRAFSVLRAELGRLEANLWPVNSRDNYKLRAALFPWPQIAHCRR